MPQNDDYLSPTEIIRSLPEVAERWDARQIGYLVHLGLVRFRTAYRQNFVRVGDVLEMLPAVKAK